ncbi:hypothetical protein APHAL10511_004724 [Amanita phalloides]|nr:hypothetical protein APHAL10511_004724 [Amanita phalloides]
MICPVYKPETRTSLLCAARPSFLQSSSPAPSLHRHSRYYLTSGNVVFRVADVLFRVWDEPLRTNSQFFSDHFLPSRIPFGSCIGCDDAPIVIDGVEPYQFDRLLGVIFPPFHRGASSFFLDYGFEEWLMVLDIATKWGFFGAREIALREISHSHPKPLDIVVLCDHYPLPTSWHMDALCHFVEREQSITVEEAHVLGEVLTVTIFTAREILGEKGRRNGEYVEYVITELFDIDITPDCY